MEYYTNNVDDETPYAKIRATIIGSIYPDLTIIPPPLEDEDNDDFFHQALRILVPIVLTIVLGPTGLGLNMVAAAAISNVVSQIIFVSTGLQRDFSLTSLLVTTLTAAIGTPISSFSEITLEQIGKNLLEHAMLNLTDQLLEVAAGIQDNLDFKQMTTAAVNGVINDVVSFKTRTLSNGVKALGSGLSTGINMGVASLIQGVPFNTERTLAQMAGTSLGVYAGMEINDYRARQKSEVHQEITQAAQSKDAKGVSQTHYARNKGPGFFAKPKTEESLLKPIRPEDVLKHMQTKNRWEEAAVHWVNTGHVASTQATIAHEHSHTVNWLDNTIYSLAYASVEANMGLEHALGISPYSLEELALKEQPLPDLLNFRFGEVLGYGMQATLILEAGPMRIAEGLYEGSALLISKVSGMWSKSTAENIAIYSREIEQAMPSGSVGSARVWTTKSRLKAAQLPNEGKVRYVPPKNYKPTEPLRRGPSGGYLDKFGNEWVRGVLRTQGHAFEWDVQLSNTGRQQLGWASRDESHLNISLDGRITHR